MTIMYLGQDSTLPPFRSQRSDYNTRTVIRTSLPPVSCQLLIGQFRLSHYVVGIHAVGRTFTQAFSIDPVRQSGCRSPWLHSDPGPLSNKSTDLPVPRAFGLREKLLARPRSRGGTTSLPRRDQATPKNSYVCLGFDSYAEGFWCLTKVRSNDDYVFGPGQHLAALPISAIGLQHPDRHPDFTATRFMSTTHRTIPFVSLRCRHPCRGENLHTGVLH